MSPGSTDGAAAVDTDGTDGTDGTGAPDTDAAAAFAEVTARLTATGAEFELAAAEVRGVPVRVYRNAPTTLRAVLDAGLRQGDAGWIVYEDECLTYAGHRAAVARLAHHLVDDLGLRPGERVAIAARNLPEWSVAFFAATVVGAIAVPLNGWWLGDELAYALADSGAAVLVADQTRLERIRSHRAALPDLRAVLAVRPDPPPTGDEEVLVLDPSPGAPDLPDIVLDTDDDATILYTSGTTGRPRGAVGSHRNICHNLMSLGFVAARARLRRVPPRPRSPHRASALLTVPLFHATGCHSVLVANHWFGNAVVMMRRWDPQRALELIEREHVTTFVGVPSMVWDLLESPDLDRRDTSSLVRVGYGGAPAPPDLVRRVAEVFGTADPSNGYGMTETSSAACMNAGVDYVRKPESVGPPVPVCDIEVVGPDDQPRPTGSVGELRVRGPNIVRGYWNDPVATAATFQDGWVRTGDLAVVDDEGFVTIVDRAKDVVIRGGENVYSVEVEDILYEHPDIVGAAVVGLAHPTLGEEVAALVQRRAGSTIDAPAVRAWVAGRLAAFKVPVFVVVRDEPLPLNANGKVPKGEVRALVAAARLADDQAALARLMAGYFRAYDDGHFDDLADLFTPDATCAFRDGVIVGRDGIRARLEPTWTPGRRHIGGIGVFDVDGDRATGQAEFVVIAARPQGLVPSSAGRYDDRYVRRDGRWWIAGRVISYV